MTRQRTVDSDSSKCGATNRHGDPCQLPAGWGTPGSGGGRCKFHGGASTGPRETSHLEDNSYAEGNPGGGAPELNTNREIHGGFADWWKAYQRFDDETREWVDQLAKSVREEAAEYAPDVDADRRDRLAREYGTLGVLERKAMADAWIDPDGDHPGRGLVIEETVDVDGETWTEWKENPALRAGHTLSGRRRQIGCELRLWPGVRDG